MSKLNGTPLSPKPPNVLWLRSFAHTHRESERERGGGREGGVENHADGRHANMQEKQIVKEADIHAWAQ